MSKKIIFTEEQQLQIKNMFESGQYTKMQIAETLGATFSSICTFISRNKIKKGTIKSNLSKETIDDICYLYINDRWSEIFKKYPFLEGKKNRVYDIASNNNCKKDKYFWNKKDIDILLNEYDGKNAKELQSKLIDCHSIRGIQTKAIKLGLTEKQDWSKEEIDILLKYYSNEPKENFMKRLPNRSYNAIVAKAMQLNVLSYHKLQELYDQEEENFIKDNFGVLTDEEIANHLGRTLHGIQDKRRKMGLYYSNKEYQNYESLAKILRGHIQDWKNESMKKCNYQCVITGSKDFVVHHLYSFNKILEETLKVLVEEGLFKSIDIIAYTKEEMDYIINLFKKVHSKYPLGVCIRRDLHKEFHKKYGNGGNTPEQWKRFYEEKIALYNAA